MPQPDGRGMYHVALIRHDVLKPHAGGQIDDGPVAVESESCSPGPPQGINSGYCSP